MSSRFAVVLKHFVTTTCALVCFACVLATFVSAQTSQPVDEILGAYSWLHPGGYADFGSKVPDVSEGFDISITHYLPQAHNVGLLVDGSGHFNSGKGEGIGFALAGVQFKYHTDTFMPFARILIGAANQSPECCAGMHWSVALGGGGGFDLRASNLITIRVAQVDYLYNNYPQRGLSGRNPQWNSIRLAAGIILNLGSYYNPPLTCTASATPNAVFAPDPVKVTTTGSGFNPKHPIAYSWSTNGGKISDASSQTATVDTTGVAAGNYAANSTITDTWPKFKNLDSGHHLNIWGKPDPIPPATCAANFTITQPQPPQVSCTANPTTIAVGEPSTITMTATDPQGWPMTYSWSATGGQLSGSGTTATLTATNADAGNTITVTGTATTNRPGGNPETLSSSCTASVTVPPVQKCVTIEDWGECTFEKNPRKPWRVDNDCKDTLDKLALRLQQMPNGKLDIVGYTNEKEVVKEKTLGSQRSVNVKYYLTTEGPTKVDAGRIQPRDGGTKGQATHFYFVPEGTMCGGQLEEGTVVDESQVQPQGRAAKPKRKAHKAKPAAPPAQ
jgi:PKD repeat protein